MCNEHSKPSEEVNFKPILKKFEEVYIVLSPPRCGSTAFARVFWEHKDIGYYNHEPFETAYYSNSTLSGVAKELEASLDLSNIKSKALEGHGKSLLIKEMTFQVDQNIPILLSWTSCPIIILIRNPFLTIYSKIEKKKKSNQDPFFPLFETGWEALKQQVQYCKDHALPYAVVDATDFRNHPESIFSQVCATYKLPFSKSILKWEQRKNVKIDNMDGHHNLFYQRVLESKGIEPATERIPTLEEFPEKGGFRQHVLAAFETYTSLRKDKNFLAPSIK